MIWSQRQVFDVERIFTRLAVSRESIDKGGKVAIEGMRSRMVNELTQYAHPLGVELDEADIRFHDTREDAHGLDLIIFTARWAPDTTEGILLGGPADGTRVSMPAAAHRWSFRVVVSKSEAAWTPGTAYPAAVEFDTLDYRWAGWHEQERVWTYEPAS